MAADRTMPSRIAPYFLADLAPSGQDARSHDTAQHHHELEGACQGVVRKDAWTGRRRRRWSRHVDRDRAGHGLALRAAHGEGRDVPAEGLVDMGQEEGGPRGEETFDAARAVAEVETH